MQPVQPESIVECRIKSSRLENVTLTLGREVGDIKRGAGNEQQRHALREFFGYAHCNPVLLGFVIPFTTGF